jgi:hypothetical protein
LREARHASPGFISHAYEDLAYEILWDALHLHFPQLQEAVSQMLSVGAMQQEEKVEAASCRLTPDDERRDAASTLPNRCREGFTKQWSHCSMSSPLKRAAQTIPIACSGLELDSAN